MTGNEAQSIALLAGTLGHPVRVRLLAELVRGPANVSDLIAAVGEEQTVVSKHLASLRAAGLLRCRPEGRCRVYEATVAEGAARVLETLAAVARDAAEGIEAGVAARA